MKFDQIFNEGYKNSYSVGDHVQTPFGVGTIVKDLGENDSKFYHFFAVLFSDDIVQKFNLENNPVRIPSSQFNGHVESNPMSEGRDMTDPEYARIDAFGYNGIPDARSSSADGYTPSQKPHMRNYDFDADRDEQKGAPLEELTPEQLEDKIREEQEQKRKLEISLANLQKLYRSKTKQV